MKIIFNNSFKKISNNEVKDFENYIKASLPKDYKSFLLEVNGGEPYPSLFKTKYDYCGIAFLYGLSDKRESGDLFYELNSFREYETVEDRHIPIGTDGYGDYICISVAGKDKDKILFGGHEHEEYQDEEGNLILNIISDSFKDLLKNPQEDKNESKFEKLLKQNKFDEAKKYIKAIKDINNFNPRTGSNRTIIDFLIDYGNNSLLEYVLQKNTKKNILGLHLPSFRNEYEKVELLIKNMFDINDNSVFENVTPLMRASENTSYECTKLLLDNGAEVNMRDANGKTALTYALESLEKSKDEPEKAKRFQEIINLLKQNGATE